MTKSYFHNDGVDTFIPILPAEYSLKTQTSLNKHRLKSKEKKEDCLGTLELKERYGGELFGFSFGLIYPSLGAREGSNLEMSVSTDKNSLFSVAGGPELGQPNKTEKWTIAILLQPKPQKPSSSPPAMVEQRAYTSTLPGVEEDSPQASPRWWQSRTAWNFIFTEQYESLPTPNVSGHPSGT